MLLKKHGNSFSAFLKQEHTLEPTAIILMWMGTVDRLLELGATAAFSDAEIDELSKKLAVTQQHYYKDAWSNYRKFIAESSIPRPPKERVNVPEHYVMYVEAAEQLVKAAHTTLEETKAIDASAVAIVAGMNGEVLRLTIGNRHAHAITRIEPQLHAVAMQAVSMSAALIDEKQVQKLFPNTIWPYCRDITFRAPADRVSRVHRRHIEQKYRELPLDEVSAQLQQKLISIVKENKS